MSGHKEPTVTVVKTSVDSLEVRRKATDELLGTFPNAGMAEVFIEAIEALVSGIIVPQDIAA